MRIKLLYDLPVGPEHGMTKGRELDVDRYDHPRNTPRGSPAYWVTGDVGESVGILGCEAEAVSDGS